MLQYYINVFRADGSEILGNMDGQASIRPKRSIVYPMRCASWRHAVALSKRDGLKRILVKVVFDGELIIASTSDTFLAKKG